MENPLPQVACKEKAVRTARPQGREKSQLRNVDILGFIHHREFKQRMSNFFKFQRHATKYVRVGHQTSRLERGPNTLENRPNRSPLRFFQASLPP